MGQYLRGRRFGWAVVIWCISVASVGCDVTKLTADTTTDLFNRATPAFEEYWDYETAGTALPAMIVQFEGILRVVPENEAMLDLLVQTYFAFAFGWVQAEVEALQFEGQYDQANAQQERAKKMFLRAKDLAMYRISLRHPDVYHANSGSVEDLEAWLKKTFTDKADAAPLLWLGQSWGGYINLALDDMTAVADLPYAVAVVERSIALDPSYYFAAGYTFLGVAESSQLAPDLDKAKSYFDKALAETDRTSLITQASMARYYAVKAQDKALFDKLLQEVLNAGDVLPEARLSNSVARVRAELYTANGDQLFTGTGTATSSETDADSGTDASSGADASSNTDASSGADASKDAGKGKSKATDAAKSPSN